MEKKMMILPLGPETWVKKKMETKMPLPKGARIDEGIGPKENEPMDGKRYHNIVPPLGYAVRKKGRMP